MIISDLPVDTYTIGKYKCGTMDMSSNPHDASYV